MQRTALATAITAALVVGAVTVPHAHAAEVGAPNEKGVCSITFTAEELAAADATAAALTVGAYYEDYAAAIEAVYPEVAKIKVERSVWDMEDYDDVEAALKPQIERLGSEIPIDLVLVYGANALLTEAERAEPLLQRDDLLVGEIERAQATEPVGPTLPVAGDAAAAADTAAAAEPADFTAEEREAQRKLARQERVNEKFWASEAGRLYVAIFDTYDAASDAAFAACETGEKATVLFPGEQVKPLPEGETPSSRTTPPTREGITWWKAYDTVPTTDAEATTSESTGQKTGQNGGKNTGTNTARSSADTQSGSSKTDDGSLTPGAIVGIVLAVGFGLFLLTGVVENLRMYNGR